MGERMGCSRIGARELVFHEASGREAAGPWWWRGLGLGGSKGDGDRVRLLSAFGCSCCGCEGPAKSAAGRSSRRRGGGEVRSERTPARWRAAMRRRRRSFVSRSPLRGLLSPTCPSSPPARPEGPISSSPWPVSGPVMPETQGASLPKAFHFGACEVTTSSSGSIAAVIRTAEEDEEGDEVWRGAWWEAPCGRSLKPRLPEGGRGLNSPLASVRLRLVDAKAEADADADADADAVVTWPLRPSPSP